MSRATGFLVGFNGTTYLISNYHVLTGRLPDTGEFPEESPHIGPDSVEIYHNAKGPEVGWIRIPEPLYGPDHVALWLEHPVRGRRVDVVALPLTRLNGVELVTHSTSEDDVLFPRLGVTSELNIIGFPFGVSGISFGEYGGGALGIWSRATIASEPEIDHGDMPLFLVDSRSRPGQSGSPAILYNPSGLVVTGGRNIAYGRPVERLVGVYSGRVNDESDLGRIWKVSALRDVVERGKRSSLIDEYAQLDAAADEPDQRGEATGS